MSQNPNPAKRTKRERKALGRWFPKGTRITNLSYSENEKISLVLFYTYVKPQWSEIKKDLAKNMIERSGEELNVGGRVRVSVEGVNATISGTKESTRAFIEELKKFDKNFKKAITEMPSEQIR